jgi:sugar/nucleoside kinase (ribokinase family)
VADRFLLVGDVIDDIVVTPSGPVRHDTDTLSSIRSVPGGSAGNTAVWLAHLGAAVDFVGIVGHDDVARHSELFSAAGVVAHLQSHSTLPTGTIVLVVDGQQRTMYTEKGANPALDLDAIPDALLDGAAVLHLTGYTLFAAADGGAAFTRLIARARQRGVHVSVDPGSSGFIADFGAERFLEAVSGASVLFPNLEEGRILTGLVEPEAIVESLERSVELVVLTMGHDGVLVAGERAPATQVEIVDPTGAGDAFSAGFLEAWVRTGEITAAARAGVAVAARAVGAVGGRP